MSSLEDLLLSFFWICNIVSSIVNYGSRLVPGKKNIYLVASIYLPSGRNVYTYNHVTAIAWNKI